jgi:hypothetical protein
MLEKIFFSAAALSWLSFIASMFTASYFGVRASLNRNPGKSHRWLVRINRFNAVYFPDELSPIGLEFRAKGQTAAKVMAVSALTFVATLAIWSATSNPN